MKTSARNVFSGTIVRIAIGAVNSEVVLAVESGVEIVAIVTNESVRALDLKVGRRAYALVKASWVIFGKDLDKAKLSTRNVLSGTVDSIHDGAVNAEVTLKLAGGVSLVGILTRESLSALEFKPGEPAGAAFKASNVILAVD
jgi:molybdate transport system regulatory protein